MGSLFQELQRRKVFSVAAVYAVVAWLLIQIDDVILLRMICFGGLPACSR